MFVLGLGPRFLVEASAVDRHRGVGGERLEDRDLLAWYDLRARRPGDEQGSHGVEAADERRVLGQGAPRHHQRGRDHVGPHLRGRRDERLVHRLAGEGAVPLHGLPEQVEFLLRHGGGASLGRRSTSSSFWSALMRASAPLSARMIRMADRRTAASTSGRTAALFN